MTAADIRWPGVDQDRAVAACWHLIRCAQWLTGLATVSGHRLGTRGVLLFAGEHMRMARGYLGAIGFEQGARL
jgi:hypothetical protein